MNYSRWKENIVFAAGAVLLILLLSSSSVWASGSGDLSPEKEADAVSGAGEIEIIAADSDAWREEDNWDENFDDEAEIPDPLEPLNRVFFHFNDKLYYWVLKPVARVYAAIFAEDVQIVVRNFFDNLKTPTSAVNSLLQGQVQDSSVEVARFLLNSTAGIFGLADVAKDVFDLPSTGEDTGQTLGYYGLGGICYINWPILGPSNLRDSIGLVGDTYLNPLTYLDTDWEVIAGVKALERVNQTALTLGDYELLTETAVDPYTALKDVYQQYRNGQIRK